MHRSFHGLRILLSSSIAIVALAAIAVTPVSADVVYINKKEEAATGTYFYPVDSNHVFKPAYYYVPAEEDVEFGLEAQDGATLHVFDDASGSNELAVPDGLKTAGQPQSTIDSNSYGVGTVHLTQGWHKLYVEYTLLSLRNDISDCYCRLHLSFGQLHDRVEPVSTEASFDDWLPTPNPDVQTSAVTAIVTHCDGVTPAAGDSLIWSIDRVTSDAQGLNPISASGVTISGDATTDVDGTAHAVVTAVSPCVGANVPHYIWFTMIDPSQQMTVPVPDGAQAAAVATISYVYTMSPLYFPGPICGGNGGGGGGGGGGGSAPYPRNVISKGCNYKEYKGTRYPPPPKPVLYPKVWGHVDLWNLEIQDQFKKPYSLGAPSEHFKNPKRATQPPNVKAQVEHMHSPPAETSWDPGADFVDTLATLYPQNLGSTSFLYSFDQYWIVTVGTKDYKCSYHSIRITQGKSYRTPHPQ